MMKSKIAAFLLGFTVLLGSAAIAQVQPGSGVGAKPPITAGNCAYWVNSFLIGDAGGVCDTTGGNAIIAPTTGNTANDILTMSNTTTGIQDSGTLLSSLAPKANPTFTGSVTATGLITAADLATQATNTILGNATSVTASPAALAIGSCSTSSSALIWTTNTGFGCNTSITASAVALGGITGLGTSVATALAVNVGTAGAFVVNGGALGTPSSGVATNLTGTAASLTAGTVTTNANLTGDVTSSGNATTSAETLGQTNVGPTTYTPTATGITLVGGWSIQTGTYVKLGGLVFVTVELRANTTFAASAGTSYVAAPPYTPSANAVCTAIDTISIASSGIGAIITNGNIYLPTIGATGDSYAFTCSYPTAG